jgi:hypothetical protein
LKTRILAPRQVLAQVDQLLAKKPSLRDFAQRKPLQDVLEALYQGRRYSWIGVSLETGSQRVCHAFCGPESPRESRSRISVPIRIASRVLGTIQAESERENAFGWPDRVLLKEVAARLARFLTSRGKVLMRHAREAQSDDAGSQPEARGYQPASAKAASLRMAAGEGRRT